MLKTNKFLFPLGKSPAWPGYNNWCDTGQWEHPWGWSDHSARHWGPHSHPHKGPPDASTNERAASQGTSYQTKNSTVLHRFVLFSSYLICNELFNKSSVVFFWSLQLCCYLLCLKILLKISKIVCTWAYFNKKKREMKYFIHLKLQKLKMMLILRSFSPL